MFLRKDVLKICSKFTGEHLCRSVISIKLQNNFIEIALRHGCSPVNLLYIFRTSFPRNTSGWQFLTVICIHSKLLIISTFDKDFDLKNTSSRWLGNIVHNISMSSSSLFFYLVNRNNLPVNVSNNHWTHLFPMHFSLLPENIRKS